MKTKTVEYIKITQIRFLYVKKKEFNAMKQHYIEMLQFDATSSRATLLLHIWQNLTFEKFTKVIEYAQNKINLNELNSILEIEEDDKEFPIGLQLVNQSLWFLSYMLDEQYEIDEERTKYSIK